MGGHASSPVCQPARTSPPARQPARKPTRPPARPPSRPPSHHPWSVCLRVYVCVRLLLLKRYAFITHIWHTVPLN